jgi:hypothetical protein
MNRKDHLSKGAVAAMIVLSGLPTVNSPCAPGESCGRLVGYFPDEQTRPGPKPFDGKDRVLRIAIATASITDTGAPTPGVTWRVG